MEWINSNDLYCPPHTCDEWLWLVMNKDEKPSFVFHWMDGARSCQSKSTSDYKMSERPVSSVDTQTKANLSDTTLCNRSFLLQLLLNPSQHLSIMCVFFGLVSIQAPILTISMSTISFVYKSYEPSYIYLSTSLSLFILHPHLHVSPYSSSSTSLSCYFISHCMFLCSSFLYDKSSFPAGF